ncbi:uncharacterized protein LOC126668764 [Mercurialis annua]|uniref:uncharacterized protein LOC126668764 n=1 Tax=Mercurialis annua TaxID=3986 RepID=UPI0021609902|nr:uncharacterized protein LOC126668764 [Mercurialis annua]
MSGETLDREEGMGYDDHGVGTDEPSTEFVVVRPLRGNTPDVEETGTSQPLPVEEGKKKRKAPEASDKNEDRDIKASRCTQGFLRAVRETFSIPVEYELSLVPEGQKLNDVPSANTIMLTLEHLQSGIRFPLREDYKQLSRYFEVPLSQIHPNGVRHFSCFLKLCEKTGVVPSMRLFCCLYLMSLTGRNHFAYLRFRSERKAVPGGLISGVIDSLRDFKEDYFQISHPSAFDGMSTSWVIKCYKPEKWFHIPGPLEDKDIAILRDDAPPGKKAQADDLCPKLVFDYWKNSVPGAGVNNIDLGKLAGKKRKRPASRGVTPAPAPVPRATEVPKSPAAKAPATTGVPEEPLRGVDAVPLRVRLPEGIEVPVGAEPVGNIPFVNLDSTETVDGPARGPADPQGAPTEPAGQSSRAPPTRVPDLPDISSGSSTTAPGPQTITRASFAEWVSRHNDGRPATLHDLVIAGDVARVTTLPADREHYKSHKPENLWAVVSSFCLQASQMAYMADQNQSRVEIDLTLAKDLLLIEKKKAREAERRASEAEKKASEGAALVATLESQLKSSEDRRAEDLGVLEKLRAEVTQLENDRVLARDDFTKQLADLTTRNDLASKGLRETVADQKKQIAEITQRAEKAEAEVKEVTGREEKIYDDFRRILYVSEVQAGEYVRGRFGADVDVSDFVLDIEELGRRAKELPEDYDVPADIEDYLADDQEPGSNPP